MKHSEELTTDCVGNLKGHTSNYGIKRKKKNVLARNRQVGMVDLGWYIISS